MRNLADHPNQPHRKILSCSLQNHSYNQNTIVFQRKLTASLPEKVIPIISMQNQNQSQINDNESLTNQLRQFYQQPSKILLEAQLKAQPLVQPSNGRDISNTFKDVVVYQNPKASKEWLKEEGQQFVENCMKRIIQANGVKEGTSQSQMIKLLRDQIYRQKLVNVGPQLLKSIYKRLVQKGKKQKEQIKMSKEQIKVNKSQKQVTKLSRGLINSLIKLSKYADKMQQPFPASFEFYQFQMFKFYGKK